MKKLLLSLMFLALGCRAPLIRAQVPVALAPTPRMQFFSEQTPSVPLAGGKVCTFNAGTTTPAATYVDIGGVFQNTNPIVLDTSGFATIYLANQEYKFIVYDNSGNNACPNTGVQQWSQDNVSAFQAVIGTQTIIFAGVTSDPTGQAGMMDYRTDLPCFRGFTTVWDCFVRLNDVQTLTNKTLTTPVINGQTTGTGLQGTDAKLLTAGKISGVSVSLCSDANGGATTTGCPAGSTVSSATSSATNFGANISTQTIVGSIPNTGVYNINFTAVQSLLGVGCSSVSNTVQFNLFFTAPGGTVESPAAAVLSVTGNGVVDSGSFNNAFVYMIVAKAGTAIQYTTNSTLNSTGCGTVPQYTVYVKAFN